MYREFCTIEMKCSTLAAALSIVAAAMLILSSSPALGAVVTTDGFEGRPASGAAYPDVSGDYDPDPVIWSTVENNAEQVQVTTYGTPGPAGGDAYLRLARNPQDAFVNTAIPTGTAPIYIKFDLYARSDKPFSAYFSLSNIDQYFIGITDGGGVNIDYLAPSGWVDSGANATLDAWREVGLEIKSYKVGAVNGSLDLWYDGVVAATIPVYATNSGAFHFLSGSGGSEYYVDNFELGSGPMPVIPEPASACLLGTGLVGLLAYAWRKRQ